MVETALKRGAEPERPPASSGSAPLVFPFRTERAAYAYDANTNRILQVSREVFDSLLKTRQERWPQDPEAAAKDDPGLAAILRLRHQGVLCGAGPRPISPLEHRGCLKTLMNTEFSQLTLEITEACNLRCRYCVYGDNYEHQRSHGWRPMPLETAQKALDYCFAHNQKAGAISIGFYGGEPLVEFERIKHVTALVHEYPRGREANLHFTTNGTLLTPEKFPFLVEHGYSLLVSLDGPQELHDRNRVNVTRRGTFSTILKNLAALKQYAPDYYDLKVAFSVVRTPNSSVQEIKDFFTENPVVRGKRVQISAVSPGCPKLMQMLFKEVKDPGQSARESNQQMGEFLTAVIRKRRQGVHWDYLQDTCASGIVRFQRRELCAGPGSPCGLNGMCIPAVRKLFVAADGSYHTCERVGRGRPIGHVDTGIDYDIIFDYLEKHWRFTDSHCRNCWAIRVCGACQSTIGGPDGVDGKKVQGFCEGERRQLGETIRVFTRMLEEDPKSFDYVEEIKIS